MDRTSAIGERTVVDFSLTPIFDADGSVNLLLAEGHDITALRKTEEELRLSRERYDLAVKGSQDGIWDWDLTTNTLKSSINAENQIFVDSERLMQVLTNLISNAIKFSPKDSEVSVKVDALKDRTLRFSVVDEGPGIPHDKKHKLFGKFQQLDSSDSRRHGGTGLGLSISKAIIEQHGGDIGVETEPGKGSIFWFDLPVAVA
jgi:signal transduction histidine kinase